MIGKKDRGEQWKEKCCDPLRELILSLYIEDADLALDSAKLSSCDDEK